MEIRPEHFSVEKADPPYAVVIHITHMLEDEAEVVSILLDAHEAGLLGMCCTQLVEEEHGD